MTRKRVNRIYAKTSAARSWIRVSADDSARKCHKNSLSAHSQCDRLFQAVPLRTSVASREHREIGSPGCAQLSGQ